jgi:hypothetical protein
LLHGKFISRKRENTMQNKQITTPEEAMNALALAANTAWQTFCLDEPPLPTLLCHMMWSAEEIALRMGCPDSVMDTYRRIVFSEHPTNIVPLTAQELRDTQTALLEFLRQTQPDAPDSRIYEGVEDWDDLIQAAAQEDAVA